MAENISDNGTPVSGEGTVVGTSAPATNNAPEQMLTYPGTSLAAPISPSNPEAANTSSSGGQGLSGAQQSQDLKGAMDIATGNATTPAAKNMQTQGTDTITKIKNAFNFEDDGLMILGGLIFLVAIWSLIGDTKIGSKVTDGLKGAAKTVTLGAMI